MKNIKTFIVIIIFSTEILPYTCFSQFKNIDTVNIIGNMKLHVIPQSHIDLSWWWRYDPQTIKVVVKHTLETAFENMEKFPDYTFTFLQVPAIEPLEKLYPELFYKLRYYVHNKEAIGAGLPNPGAGGDSGRLAIGSGLWCEADGALPCGESLVRQCLYGKRYYKNQFGIDVKTAWFQDAWTHPWTYPQILKKSGIESYMFTRPRIMGEERMFWWESADGSRVFAYKPLVSWDNYNLPSKESIDKYLMELNRKYGVHDGITLIGVGNHGGGAIRADVERMKSVMQERNLVTPDKMKQAQIAFSTPKQFTSEIFKNPGDFPVIKYELKPTIRGAYTSVGEIKKGNRYSENLLMTLEKYSSIASALGANVYPGKSIYDSWKKLMINQYHDPISGTDINPSIDDVLLRYKQIKDTASSLLNLQVSSIAGRINTHGEGSAIIVFNPLSWERTDLVEVELELHDSLNHFSIVDENNQKIPIQIINHTFNHGVSKISVIFIAKNIPSMGYSTYRLKSEKRQQLSKNISNTSRFVFENEFFRLKIDSLTGCLIGLTDKLKNQEIIASNSSGNIIQIIDDFGDSEGFLLSPEGNSESNKLTGAELNLTDVEEITANGEFNKWTGAELNLTDVEEIKVLENGPVRTTLQIKRKYNLSRFIQRIYLYNGINRIDFELVVDWQGKNKMVKVAFPLNLQNDSATYDIPYGTIKRPSQGEEQVGQKWVDISDEHYGVSLLNDSRYGYDVTKNTIRLSLLRSPDHPVEATDEKGIHQIKYSLYPHQGNWQTANTMRKGYEFNYPLIAINESSHNGPLSAKHSFIEISPENLIVTTLKKAEDSDDLILRFFETTGNESIAKVKLSKFIGINAVHKTDLMENELEDIPVSKNLFEVKVGKYSIESFKLIKDFYQDK
ncbi:MAG: glycoside hydrolase family 38 C-terminal domain-containing protein [Puia sp.]